MKRLTGLLLAACLCALAQAQDLPEDSGLDALLIADEDSPASEESAAPDTSPSEALYRIDLLVFANDNPAAADEERWSPPKSLPVPANARLLLDEGSEGTPFARLRADEEFRAAATRLRGSRYYRVLHSSSWQQPLPPGAAAQAIVIRGGREIGPHHELEGTVQIRRERYLHAHVGLWLSQTAENGIASDDWPSLPQLPGASDSITSPAALSRLVLIDQRRRMRSGEYHYFDHPLFGVLLRVTPPAKPVVANNTENPTP